MADKDYQEYELADFLADADFKRWIVGVPIDPLLEAHWQQVVLRFPQKATTIAEARTMAAALRQLPVLSNPASQARMWEQIAARTADTGPLTVRPVKWFRFAGRYAAAILVLAGAVLGADYYVHRQSVFLLTGNGQDTVFHLPDGSRIMLGPNSSLSYRHAATREIWLSGEAYFDVAPAPQHRFMVHVGDSIEVQVLGTAFLVKNRRGNTSISLDKGLVQVQVKGAPLHRLQPGETLLADTRQHTIIKTETAPQETRHWQERVLVLKETPVRDIITMIADNYHRQLIITDTTLLNKKVDGVLPANNEQQALHALSSILDADIFIQEHTIQLKARNK
ncbi:FecR family protein [Chitinophaga arvensicola]|uniref:Ferric-dicitrate binding protein FerR, regulates iron transport through sigma-19 n=1 Tax=Chitinophaga arvensicola TaxID=29529 RepID=A0A1I0RPI2_9BACT|nr:FecR domain-containing protein [Chitinophaga arvensicola]SEW43169.1 ferric-dicitrate binding protein FerR, regulates iron transport through sigma-19 [Chitinophaga arvensicola]